jgi:hypothetical protein
LCRWSYTALSTNFDNITKELSDEKKGKYRKNLIKQRFVCASNYGPCISFACRQWLAGAAGATTGDSRRRNGPEYEAKGQDIPFY